MCNYQEENFILFLSHPSPPFFFLAILEVELRTSCLRHSNHLNHSTSPFCVGYFEIGSHFMPGLDLSPPICAFLHDWDDRCTSPCLAMGWDEVSTFPSGLSSNQDPPDLCLPSSSDYRLEPLHLACLLSFKDNFSDLRIWGIMA
jgi:hypothetical protein